MGNDGGQGGRTLVGFAEGPLLASAPCGWLSLLRGLGVLKGVECRFSATLTVELVTSEQLRESIVCG